MIFNSVNFSPIPPIPSICTLCSGTTNDIAQRTDQSQGLATMVDVAAILIPPPRPWNAGSAPPHRFSTVARCFCTIPTFWLLRCLTHDMHKPVQRLWRACCRDDDPSAAVMQVRSLGLLSFFCLAISAKCLLQQFCHWPLGLLGG